MHYKSSVSKVFYVIFPLFIIGVFVLHYLAPKREDGNETLIPIIFLPLMIGIFMLAISKTKYYIEDSILVCQILFYKYKVTIETIRKIEYNHTIFVSTTTKLGWDNKGLIVHFNKFDDYFISPENKEQFIAELQKINPNIEIKK